jgi:hypothetical protein
LKEQLIVEKFGRRSAFSGTARLFAAALAYVVAIYRWPEYRAIRRLRFAAWALAMVLLPRRLLMAIPGIAGGSVRLRPP